MFEYLEIYQFLRVKMKMWDRSYDHQICTVDSS